MIRQQSQTERTESTMYEHRHTASLMHLFLPLLLVGCATVPRTERAQSDLVAQAKATLDTMRAADPSLRDFIDRAYACVVFPEIGEGGFVVGGAFGRGVVFERGKQIAWAELGQASIGAQLGGQTFAELIVLRDAAALRDFMHGGLRFGAEASAVAVTAGAAQAVELGDRAASVFILPKAGLMAGVSITGQEIDFMRKEPLPRSARK